MTKLDNSHITKVLGQTVTYPDQYDPSILVREPRSNNRQHLSIEDDDLPFVGYDTWNAYEVSTLTEQGLPVAGCMKIVYPCDSTYIVESKSIKLYLNSFNMFKCGPTREEAISRMTRMVTRDLNELLETQCEVHFLEDSNDHVVNPVFDHSLYELLEYTSTNDVINDITFDTYQETPELLKTLPVTKNNTLPEMHYWRSGLLKSNCRVTSQPDWGDIYIKYSGNTQVTPLSLLKYIVSFRDECHFHEEICETVYKRLYETLQPHELCVTCLYARRGGIDINPVRASSLDLISPSLIDSKIMHHKTMKQ
jgi:7-cyano-7-deazaguanine reductase